MEVELPRVPLFRKTIEHDFSLWKSKRSPWKYDSIIECVSSREETPFITVLCWFFFFPEHYYETGERKKNFTKAFLKDVFLTVEKAGRQISWLRFDNWTVWSINIFRFRIPCCGCRYAYFYFSSGGKKASLEFSCSAKTAIKKTLLH